MDDTCVFRSLFLTLSAIDSDSGVCLVGDLTISFGFELPGRKAGRLQDNWIGRFTDAYIGELRAWVASIKDGVANPNLATVDDGIAASIACEKGIASL
jgi:myo-inositol 2-dehydrogenase/D-chiro-inositol 1-dehydrogenase